MKFKINKSKYIPYYVIFIVSFLISTPLINDAVVYGHDLPFHFFRLQSTASALLDGQLIPLVDPNAAGGFGYAWNFFYGVLSTYIVTFLKLFMQTWSASINLFLFLTILFSGIFMYHFVKDLFKNDNIALIAGLLYLSAPYHLVDIYVRQAIGEVLCFVFIPILFHGIHNLLYDDGEKGYYITIGTAGLVLSHNLSTYMTLIMAIIYLMLNYKKVFRVKVMKKTMLWLTFAILISLITIIPLLECKFTTDYPVFNSEYMRVTNSAMQNNALQIARLFSDSLFQQVSMQTNLLSETLPVGLGLHFIIPLILIPLVINKFKVDDKKHILKYLIIGLLCILLATSFFPWEKMPSFLLIFQFPWRFLQFANFFLSIVVAAVIFKLFDKVEFKQIGIIIFAILISVNYICGYATFKGTLNDDILTNNDLYLKLENTDIISGYGLGDSEYLTMKALNNYDYISNRGLDPLILDGDATISSINKGGTKLSFVINGSRKVLVELPYIYYPGYYIYGIDENNQKIKFESIETDNGLLGFYIDDNSTYAINSKFTGTNLTKAAYAISFLTIIVFIVYVFKTKWNLYKVVLKK